MTGRVGDSLDERGRRWVAEAAYFRWVERGGAPGSAEDDWRLAERDHLVHVLLGPEGEDAHITLHRLNFVSYGFGLIDEQVFVQREICCHDVVADSSRPEADQWSDVRELDDREADVAREQPSAGSEGAASSRICPALGGDDAEEQDWVEFMPGLPGLRVWTFHQHDEDPSPSVPHGHEHGKPYPKLDPYQGWLYSRPGKTSRRLTRKDTRALWNDETFRRFALRALKWFITKNPKFTWRVNDPLRLPRVRR